MRPITLAPSPAGNDAMAWFQWIKACLAEIERASQEEPAQIFDSYSSDIPATITRQINVTTPTAANLAAVLATLIADMQARGVSRTQAT